MDKLEDLIKKCGLVWSYRVWGCNPYLPSKSSLPIW